jgi:hypothetical protein
VSVRARPTKEATGGKAGSFNLIYELKVTKNPEISDVTRVFKCTLLLLSAALRGFSQGDSTVYSPHTSIPDAIFISYYDLRHNNGIHKEEIVSEFNREQLDFIKAVVSEPTVTYKEGDRLKEVASSAIYGFFQNGTFYINYNHDFYRVPVFGSIGYLVASVKVMNAGFYDPGYGFPVGSGVTRELREFLVNFHDGVITEFSMKKAEALLARDTLLFSEYKKLNRRKEKEQVYRFIRRYNDLHPVYFLKPEQEN